jgi:uncharacterized membrane protein YgcG
MMRCRTPFALLAALAVAVPVVPRADEWGDGGPPGDYDVSVDLNVQGSVTFESFHGALQPYGDWVVAGSYGRVWRPRVAAGWRPYYYGRWEWTNEGWLWVSDEPWGWAAYHYGRWAYDPYYGWLWVPGYEWAPAWVSWRTSGDVIGWAPLAPGFSVYVSSYPYVDFWWTFVPCVRFVSVPVHTVAYAPGHGRRWFDATAPAPARPPRGVRPGPAPTPAWGGPAPRLIEQRVGRPIAPARIVRAPSPGERGRPGEIPVYRPDRPVRDEASRVRGRPPRDERAWPAPAPGGNGRGPGPAPAPGWTGRERGAVGAGGDGRAPGGGVRPAPRVGGQAGPAVPNGGRGRADVARPGGDRGDVARPGGDRGGGQGGAGHGGDGQGGGRGAGRQAGGGARPERR